jgi:hypothetical protein
MPCPETSNCQKEMEEDKKKKKQNPQAHGSAQLHDIKNGSDC